MKLKDFFEEKAKLETSQEQKFSIYEKIFLKQEKQSFFNKISFYIKTWVYTFIILFFSYALYFWAIDNTKNTNHIWEITASEWKFNINRNWKEVYETYITNKDLINVYSWASLDFNIHNSTYAKIGWKAEFKLSKTNNTYFLNIIQANSLELSTNKTNNENILLTFENIEIKNINDSLNMDININKEKNKIVIENFWSEIDFNKIWEKNTFSIKEWEEAIIWDKVIKKKDENNIHKIWNEYNITWTQWSKSNWKKVLSSVQLSELRWLLHSSFVEKDIKNIVINYLKWNKSAYNISYDNLSQRIENIYSIFNFEQYSQTANIAWNIDKSIENVFLTTDQLIARINKEYQVPFSYEKKLKTLLAWLFILKNNDFWKFEWEELDFNEIFDKLNISSHKNNLTFR